MEAFYVCMIFLGAILVLVSLFFIAMDKVNGKDFFQEFDRRKDEMFNLISDAEEMIHELNRMSDYVVTTVSERYEQISGTKPEAVSQTPENTPSQTVLPEIKDIETPVTPTPEDKPELSNSGIQQAQVVVEVQKPQEIKSKISMNDRRAQVLELIKQGLSNDEISEKLKIGKGEVGLIRGLSK
jgi:hypothetical protein